MDTKKTMKRRDFLKISALAGVAVVVAACTPTVTPTAAPTAVPKATGAATAVPKATEAATAVPTATAVTKWAGLPGARDECMILGVQDIAQFDNFNPFVPQSWDNQSVGAACVEHLWYVNLDSGKIIPWLATDYKYNSDYTQLTITLRQGVKWSDDEPFTSADVTFSVETVMAHEEMGYNKQFNDTITSVKATDDLTVDFVFKVPSPRFHTLFFCWTGAFRIVPKHIWEKEENPVLFKNNPPIFTGPYKLNPTTRADGMLILERRDNYWAVEQGLSQPLAVKYYIERIEPPPDAALEEAIVNVVDVPHFQGNYDQMAQLKTQNPKFELSTYQDPCPRGFYMNCETIPNPQVRRAIQFCCNRDKIGAVVWRPASKGTTYPWASYGWLANFESADALAKFPLAYNPAEATKLLDGLGFKPGSDGIRVDDKGKKLSYLCLTPTVKGQPEYEIAADLVSDLQKVGIELQVKGYSVFETMYDQWTAGQADMASIWMCGATPDPMDFYGNFLSKWYKPIGQKVESASWESSPCRLQDPRLDDLYAQIFKVEPLSAEAKPLYQQALEVWLEDSPGFPSIETLYTMPFNNTYWTNWPNTGNWYMVPFTWWDNFKWVLHGLKSAAA